MVRQLITAEEYLICFSIQIRIDVAFQFTALFIRLFVFQKLKAPLSVELPSPAPLDTDSITLLLQKCSRTSSFNKNLNSLNEKLALLREQVSNDIPNSDADKNC